jgi:putative tryptophan/tyrosine transport system substrate-binding protein
VIARRALLVGTAAAALARSRATEAQQAARVPLIGFLGPSPGAGQLVQSFQQGLRDLGYIEGQNITVEYRSTDVISADPQQLDVLAAELVGLRVDVLVVSVTQVIAAAKRATSTIPIVMANAADPVASGFVVSLARPGGNITGVSRLSPELLGKQLEFLIRMVPRTTRVGILLNPDNPLHAPVMSQLRHEAATLGVELESAEASAPTRFDIALEGLRRRRVGAMLVLGDGMFFLNGARLGNALLQARLPSMFGNTEHVEAGGLMSYSPSSRQNYRRAAYFVDRILKGAKPADLPVEQPTTFELAINLKTAKALGLTIPSALLAQVDQLIE